MPAFLCYKCIYIYIVSSNSPAINDKPIGLFCCNNKGQINDFDFLIATINPKFPEEKKQLKKKVKINNEIIVFVENNK